MQNAIDQARCVAARVSGKPAAYQAVPWFWTNQGSMGLQIAGLRGAHCEEVVRGDPRPNSCSVFSFHDGQLACVDLLNRASDHVLSRRLLAGRIALSPQQAADANFELKSLLGARHSST